MQAIRGLERLESPFPVYDIHPCDGFFILFQQCPTWRYKRVPIFVKKEGERLIYRVFYGTGEYTLPNIYRAMSVIDTLTTIRFWQELLPNDARLQCPRCTSCLRRDAFFAHYVEKHVLEPEKPDVVLPVVEVDLKPFLEKYCNNNTLADDFLLDNTQAA